MSGDLARAPEGFSIEALIAMAEAIPPAPIFGICNLFSASEAYHWKEGQQEYCIAAKPFWDRIPKAPANIDYSFNLRHLAEIRIRDLDDPEEHALRREILASFGRQLGFRP